MPIILDGSSLTIEKLLAIARQGEKVELAPAALERIKVCRAMLETNPQSPIDKLKSKILPSPIRLIRFSRTNSPLFPPHVPVF